MDWLYFGKRLALALIICIPLSWITTILVFRIWTLYNFALTTLLIGLIMLLFGGCLRTPFIEGMAAIRYAVNPQSTRDTTRHFSKRREEQSASSVIILATAAILIGVSLLCFALVPFLLI